jgi:hypothetical protein
MTGRGASPSDEQQDRGRGTGRLLLVAAMALALVAAAVLVLSDNARWLRLAVVSALWAALVGAFLAARYRRQVADREDEVADLQSVYELELEREVAARREYELEIEAEARKRIQEEARDDLDALRDELRALRENLQALLGGEVLVERVALRAESTRMRSISDQSRLMAVGDRQIINTESERVRGITAGPSKPQVKKVQEKQPVDRTELIERVVQEAPRKPARPEPMRQPNRTEPVRREPSRAPRPPQPPVVVRRDPPKPPEPQPIRRDQPTARVNRSDMLDSKELRLNPQAPPQDRRPEPPPRRPEPPKPVVPPKPKPEPEPSRRNRAAADRTEMFSRDVVESPTRAPLPPPASVEEPKGGGRRRADDRPSWDGVSSWESGRGEPVKPGRRSAPDPDEAGGAHADGKSVSELLAALGNAESPRRRRRRED